MSSKKDKARSWEEIDKETQNKLLELRKREKELLEKSGYIQWRKMFVRGYGLYAITYYLLFIYKNQALTTKSVGFLFLPAFPFAYILMYKYFDPESYKQYYLNHIELNRVIKKTSKSSEYK
jgi:hypothetical protein